MSDAPNPEPADEPDARVTVVVGGLSLAAWRFPRSADAIRFAHRTGRRAVQVGRHVLVVSAADADRLRAAGAGPANLGVDVGPRPLTALEAAARVLAEVGTPLTVRELVTAIEAAGLWTSTRGGLPEATLRSALQSASAVPGDGPRFVRVGRGRYTLAGE